MITTVIQHYTGDNSQCNKARQGNKHLKDQSEKKPNTPTPQLFTYDMIMYVGNQKILPTLRVNK